MAECVVRSRLRGARAPVVSGPAGALVACGVGVTMPIAWGAPGAGGPSLRAAGCPRPFPGFPSISPWIGPWILACASLRVAFAPPSRPA